MLGYNISLNGFPYGQAAPEDTTFFFDNLAYGFNYMACINAIYGCGESQYVCDDWNSGFLHPPRSFDNLYNTGEWSLSLQWLPPKVTNTDSIPKGLLGFVLYQNDEILDSIPYSGQSTGEQFVYEFDSLPPLIYKFDILAQYDLTDYGFPGDSGVSAKESTIAPVAWGSIIPYLETWDPDSDNIWHLGDSLTNWKIDNGYGNPAPSAKFDKLPLTLEPYESSLTSSFIRADSLTLGDIILSFDLRLNDKHAESTEMLVVEINNGDGWIEIDRYYNNGNIPLTNYEYDVTEICMSKFFRIRFTAKGEKTNNIFAWYIDNISFDRICPQPRMLEATVDWHSFDNPANKIEWICTEGQPVNMHYDNGQSSNHNGLDENVFLAVRYSPEQINSLGPVKKVKYFVADSVGMVYLLLKVVNQNGGGSYILEEEVTEVTNIGSWTEIEFDEPIEISDNKWFYIVLYLENYGSNKKPISTDNSQEVVGYGNLISFGYWSSFETLDQYGIDGNLNIQCYFESSHNVSGYQMQTEHYYVYRMDEFTSPNYVLYDSVQNIPYQYDYVYYDTVPNVNLMAGYYYQVTAVNSNAIDNCESLPGYSKNIPEEDFVYVFLEGKEESGIANDKNISIYPNPSNERIYINSESEINRIVFYDISGKKALIKENLFSKNIDLDINFLPLGLYIVSIESSKANVFMKVVVSR